MAQGLDKKLFSVAGMLIAAASVASCGNDNRLAYSDKDLGQAMPDPKKLAFEQCYGVSLAQQNDCATRSRTDCAGTADEDYLPEKWKWVEAGGCEELGGSLSEPDPVFVSQK